MIFRLELMIKMCCTPPLLGYCTTDTVTSLLITLHHSGTITDLALYQEMVSLGSATSLGVHIVSQLYANKYCSVLLFGTCCRDSV